MAYTRWRRVLHSQFRSFGELGETHGKREDESRVTG